MDLRKIFINFALLGIVIFGMMSFIVVTQNNNDSFEKIGDNEIINDTYASLYSNLSTAQSTASEQNQLFGNVTPTESYGEVQIDSVVPPTKAFKSVVLGIYNVIIKLPSQILGVPAIVTSIISAILIILLIIGIWAIWKGSVVN